MKTDERIEVLELQIEKLMNENVILQRQIDKTNETLLKVVRNMIDTCDLIDNISNDSCRRDAELYEIIRAIIMKNNSDDGVEHIKIRYTEM